MSPTHNHDESNIVKARITGLGNRVMLSIAIVALSGCSVSLTINPVADVPDNVGTSPLLSDRKWRRIAVLPPRISQQRSSESIFVPLHGPKPSYSYLTTDEGLELLSRLEPALINRGYTLVERGYLERVLQEHDLTSAGIISDANSIQRLGQILNADTLLVLDVRSLCYTWMYKWDGRGGYVGVPLGSVSLNARAVDVQTAAVLWTCAISRTTQGILHKDVVVRNTEVLSKGLHSTSLPGLGKLLDQAVTDLVAYFPSPPTNARSPGGSVSVALDESEQLVYPSEQPRL